MRKFRRIDGYDEKEMLRAAIDHLEAAQHLFTREPSWFDSGGYLCHLGVELLLKAFLLTMTDEFQDTHSLPKLVKQLSDHSFCIEFSNEDRSLLQRLQRLYRLRYPQLLDPVQIGNADWKAVERITFAIVDRMPDSLRGCFEDIRRPRKGGRILMRKQVNR